MVQSKVSIQLKKKKKTQESSLLPIGSSVLGNESDNDDTTTTAVDEDRPPLIIPVQENTHQRFSSNNAADEAAARALEQKQEKPSQSKSASFTIPSSSNTYNEKNAKNNDATIYRTELAQLPAPLIETDDAYERIPIADFGAAMLRGMGWKDETTKTTSGTPDTTEQDNTALPRPHRLGLGAVPVADDATKNRHRPRRMDEYRRDQRRAEQVQQYQQQHQAQLQEDPQRTLQVNSIVFIVQDNEQQQDRRRARMVQLRGVPGLNRVRVLMEGESATQDIPRRWAQDLVPRSALLERPFRETMAESGNDDDDKPGRVESSSTNRTAPESSQVQDEEHGERKKSDRKKKKRKHRDNEDRSSKQQKKRPLTFTWLVPHIRVRIVSERYGSSYFRQKAIVVDVTPQGATLQLQNVILDHVQERHLVTALPSVDGHCVVVGSSPHKGTIGRLLERNKHTAVLQERENGSVLSLPLDDLAEWCGGENDDV